MVKWWEAFWALKVAHFVILDFFDSFSKFGTVSKTFWLFFCENWRSRRQKHHLFVKVLDFIIKSGFCRLRSFKHRLCGPWQPRVTYRCRSRDWLPREHIWGFLTYETWSLRLLCVFWDADWRHLACILVKIYLNLGNGGRYKCLVILRSWCDPDLIHFEWNPSNHFSRVELKVFLWWCGRIAKPIVTFEKLKYLFAHFAALTSF